MKIYEDMRLPKMVRLAASSKATIDSRLATEGFSHKWGPTGERGIIKCFIS
jgi:hypothetical protein